MLAGTASGSPYKGYRLPPEIISHAAWLYHRFSLSHREVEALLAERGIEVSYEAIRLWCRKFGPVLATDVVEGHVERSATRGRASASRAPTLGMAFVVSGPRGR